MKKILQVVGSLDIGGAETLLINLSRAISRERAELLSFLVFEDSIGAYENELLSRGCAIYRTPKPSPLAPWIFDRHFASICKEAGGFAAVHSHINFASGAVLAAARRQNIPIRIAHAHVDSTLDTSLLRFVYHDISRRVLLRNVTQMIACSDSSGRFLFGDIWDSSGLLVHNAVDVSKFQTARGRRDALRSELGLTPETLAIGAFSRLADVKNLAFLLEVLERDHAIPQMHLLVAGMGPELESLQRQAEARGVQDRVTWLGVRRDIPELMDAVDVFALPSLVEGLPVALIESQASGLPSVVSTVVTRDAAIVDGLVRFEPVDDPNIWVSALRQQSEASVPAEIVEQALVSSGYSIESFVSILSQIYGWDSP